MNADTAKIEAEILLAARPEYEKHLKQIKFSRKYLSDFFRRYGWRWGVHEGSKKYVPEQEFVLEVNPDHTQDDEKIMLIKEEADDTDDFS